MGLTVECGDEIGPVVTTPGNCDPEIVAASDPQRGTRKNSETLKKKTVVSIGRPASEKGYFLNTISI